MKHSHTAQQGTVNDFSESTITLSFSSCMWYARVCVCVRAREKCASSAVALHRAVHGINGLTDLEEFVRERAVDVYGLRGDSRSGLTDADAA